MPTTKQSDLQKSPKIIQCDINERQEQVEKKKENIMTSLRFEKITDFVNSVHSKNGVALVFEPITIAGRRKMHRFHTNIYLVQ